MIKRRFFREEHGDRDAPSDSCSSASSSSDSEVEAEATDESDDYAAVAEAKGNNESCSSSSGYRSEDISADEDDVSSSGFTNEDDGTGNEKKIPVGPQISGKHGAAIFNEEFDGVAQKESPAGLPDFVLKFKSVYKCRICPRIVCLTEETMRTHLNSKRHTRSEKLLKENRLKAMLNSDGEVENQETPAEMHDRIVALAENKSKKKNKGRQRQKKRSRKKKGEDVPNVEKTKGSTKARTKKRRKSEN
ncbi:uncharacterized protein LOC110609858 isoform X2 [Manihot esculenta]|uniref:Uncharacterized protein n=4 Tax=Manihot esculenta TaxID=3983 RepID=A0ACB7IBT1_MANES|nr:uncharacterized protein LOC110609858 isoform X2 [Manihot esculenta]KAG8662507.1 hypothetical protein MANES_01G113800v8 [Manihot esculenta]KAG8662508.1 hypothetical protein MANES_01G113800v8 [Manihot esculenta]KAG8662509.1 hypothetical protein MANES_01G113800v8 [Manihot esculenta]